MNALFKFKKKHILLFVVLLLFALGAAACGPDDEEGTPDDAIGTGGEGVVTTLEPLDEDGILGEDEGALPEATPVIGEYPGPAETPVIEEPAPGDEALEPTPTLEAAVTEPEAPAAEATAVVEPVATDEAAQTGTDAEAGAEADLPTHAILASDLVGMDIVNAEGEEVGEVGELLVNPDGSIQNAIFNVGGFLGIGDKSVAITWDEMQFQRHPDLVDAGEDVATVAELAADDLVLTYTGAAADLEALPEFDTSILDDDGYVLGEDADPNDDFDASPFAGQIEVDEFQDFNLHNTQGEDLGEVEDLIVDLADGRVAYTLVDFGGFLGAGEHTVAVPWEELQLNVTEDGETFTLDVDQAQIEAAQPFDAQTWSYPVEADWDAALRESWEVS